MGHDVAIVHDYLTQCGGAERVVLAMARAFPGAPIYTSLYVPAATFPEFADHDVRPCGRTGWRRCAVTTAGGCRCTRWRTRRRRSMRR